MMNSKGKILVVDDDRLVLATVTHGLSTAGYLVIDADNGDDAILLAREHRPELALLDIRMEGKSGFDVAAYLREYLQTPFMFLSAFADDATIEQVRALGAVAYLIKPLDIAQIVPAVEAALTGVRAQRATAAGLPASHATAAAAAAEPAGDAPAASLPATPSDALADPVPLAIGVLMHRFSLARGDALERLTRLAAAEQRTLPAQAQALLDAVEVLARSALR
jgi:response regulator NasT